MFRLYVYNPLIRLEFFIKQNPILPILVQHSVLRWKFSSFDINPGWVKRKSLNYVDVIGLYISITNKDLNCAVLENLESVNQTVAYFIKISLDFLSFSTRKGFVQIIAILRRNVSVIIVLLYMFLNR